MTPALRPPPVIGVYNRAADSYERIGVPFFAVFGERLVNAVGVAPGQDVLDVGCGRGHCLFPAAERVGGAGSVLGVDLASRMIALTGNEIAARGLAQATVRLDDAAWPVVPSGSFDVVLAGFVLTQLPHPLMALRHHREALRSGGRLGVSTWGALDAAMTGARRAIASFSPNKLPPGEMRDDVGALVAEAGFTDVHTARSTLDVEFRDGDQFWAWLWSHGFRGWLEKVDMGDMPAVRDAVLAAASVDGKIRTRWSADLTTATAP